MKQQQQQPLLSSNSSSVQGHGSIGSMWLVVISFSFSLLSWVSDLAVIGMHQQHQQHQQQQQQQQQCVRSQ
jgi:hypothetical protein